MSNRVYFPQHPVEPLKPGPKKQVRSDNNQKSNFEQVLDKSISRNEIKFSRHAQERLKARNIEMSDKDIERLNSAMDRARQKGSRDSLVLMNDVALVVSIKNNTVVTAVDGESIKENVFSNIDSAVII